MARDYARIMTVIWKNKDFRALEEGDQRMYLLLVTQPDIDAAGMLHISLDWWAEMASDSQPEVLAQRLTRLERGRFIGVDRVSNEVLIRSFLRWDGGYHNPKRKPVITRAIEGVRSERLMEMIAGELRRVGAVELMSGREPGSADDEWASDPPDGQDGEWSDDQSTDTSSQVECLPGSEPGSEPGSRMVTTSVSSGDTATHNPQPTTRPSGRTSDRVGTDAADAPLEIDEGFDQFWALYPRKIKKMDARKAWRTVRRRKVSSVHLINAARRHAAGWLVEGKDPEFIPYPASWLRGEAYNDEPEAPARGGTSPPRGTRTRDDKRAAVGSVVAEVFGSSALRPDLRSIPGGNP